MTLSTGIAQPRPPQRILIIGGGPGGLVSLRNLLKRGKFKHVELWERRDNVGGVWYLDSPSTTTTSEQTTTTTAMQGRKPRWPSPAYRGLIGNVLPEFLSFSEFPFPEPRRLSTCDRYQPFPSLVETHGYLKAFAEPFLKAGLVKLNRDVVSVVECEDGGWKVTYRDWNDDLNRGSEAENIWDAVVVAVSWYDHPVWPQTEGIEELKRRGLAKHAKWYQGPEPYEGKRTLVIGNANSSNDMAAHLSTVSDGPVYQSVRRPAFPGFPSLASPRIKMVAPVSKYILKEDIHKFDAVLMDGSVLRDLDYVHCGTGYRPLPNFIHVLDPDDDPSSITKGKRQRRIKPFTSEEIVPWRVPSLHRLVMYAYNPTLAFINAPMVYTPFTVADVVSTWLSLAWLGEVPYPSTPEGRLVFERERLELIERRRSAEDEPSSFVSFNVMAQDEQEYAAGFRRDIVKARAELDEVLPVWNDERTERREAMFKMKYEALC